VAELQHTLAGPAILAGIGIHTGAHVRLSIRQAPVNSGIVFVRTDIRDKDNRVAARGENVTKTQLGTVIENASGVTVSTIEHLMAAFWAVGVDNAVVELDGPEVPIMDGSSVAFLAILDRVGVKAQTEPRRYIEILEPVEVIENGKRAVLSPAKSFELAFEIHYDNSAAVGRQRVDMAMDGQTFREELADCRTFGFLEEVEALRRIGLARGGSLENCVVIDGDRVLNPEGLRRPDEFVRHKALDAIGDLYVLGGPIIGRFEGVCGGHSLNNAIVRALLANPQAWRLRPPPVDLAQAM
jgi:UDP-3-O-[3-hydroxymyristoyl] N-acetylglucosamine deacetylase